MIYPNRFNALGRLATLVRRTPPLDAGLHLAALQRRAAAVGKGTGMP